MVSESAKKDILVYLTGFLNGILNKYDRKILDDLMLKENIFDPKDGKYKPFHSRLIPTELFRFQAFFRSFSTSLGQGVFEFMALTIAKENSKWKKVEKRKIPISQSEEIGNIINSYMDKLEESGTKTDKDYTLPTFPSPGKFTTEAQVDLYLKDKNDREYFVEIKSPKPNKGQTKDTMRDLLYLKASYPDSRIIFGLTFNPYGEDRSNYKWTYPKYYFDITNSKILKIGKGLWDFLGGENAYEEILGVFEKVGNEREEEIKEKLLG